jgi:hypothetical protein
MPMGTEPEQVNNVLTMSREPKGPKRAGDPGSVGDQALMDALIIVALAWALLFLLTFTLRRHNI